MSLSVFDLFKIGIGPSSSHTVGPMRAARMFAAALEDDGLLGEVRSVRAQLFGSLGATGHGHGSVKAVVLGLEGAEPELVDPAEADPAVARVRAAGELRLLGKHPIGFALDDHIVLHRRRRLPFHSNGMTFTASGSDGQPLAERTYYSVGGGFVLDHAETAKTSETSTTGEPRIVPDPTPLSHPFATGAELLALTRDTGLTISAIMLANEQAWRSEQDIRSGLLHIWSVMQECVRSGCAHEGTLPGGLRVRRRAPDPAPAAARRERRPRSAARHGLGDPVRARGERGERRRRPRGHRADQRRGRDRPRGTALLHAVRPRRGRRRRGALPADRGGDRHPDKENASISGAEVGCQGEVGSACAMAAAGLTEVLGGTPEQVENAAEIAIEHHLGLTCDPVGGLVQIPCIERNAVASVKAITAARMALRGDGRHHVSLDQVIKTMRETGADMKVKYKETARGGLAVNVIEC